MEIKKQTEEASSTYETGVTQPGKSYRSIVAVLLMAVIFLSGVVTALGLMNVRLFRELKTEGSHQAAPVSFEEAQEGISPYTRMDVGTQIPELGVWYVMVSGICNQYYDIPMGPMVTSASSSAICAGDILRSVKGQPVHTAEDLQSVLAECESGEQVAVIIYRPSEKKELEVILPVEK